MRLDCWTPYKECDAYRVVDSVSAVKCSVCRRDYTPDNTDISLKSNLFFKSCKNCRFKRLLMKEKSLRKKAELSSRVSTQLTV